MTDPIRTLIAANWKMHGDLGWATKPAQFEDLMPAADRAHLDVLICPPAILLTALTSSAEAAHVRLGGQDIHAAVSGAHTGQMSAEMFANAGATYIIVGHSECRAAGDTDADVYAKAEAAARAGLTPIICVGETLDQREAGDALSVVQDQITASVPEISDYVIAYEPVWAIGTGKVATPQDVAEMHDAIRDQVGEGVRLLYGGSVKPANAEALLALENVNGALIGGAGLDMESLAEIAKLAPKHG